MSLAAARCRNSPNCRRHWSGRPLRSELSPNHTTLAKSRRIKKVGAVKHHPTTPQSWHRRIRCRRSRARTCAGVTTSLEPHDPRPLTLSGYEHFVRERRRVVHEGYGPGFRYRTPLFPPRGILVPIPNPGPYPVIFFANREAEKHPAELQRVRVHRIVWVTAKCAPPFSHTQEFAGQANLSQSSDWCILN
jgi:hypothetical protein